MENPVQIFEHEKFGKVRVVTIDGEPWFVGVDVCKALALQNYRDAVSKLDGNEKRTVLIPARGVGLTDTRGGYQNMLVVNEPGLYRLVFASRKKEARDFQNWVYYEVLPSIRKYGYYSIFGNETAPVPATAKNARSEAQKRPARVYAAELGENIVKIGHSSTIRTRVAKIENQSKLTVQKIKFTPLMSRENARLVEWACQKNFSSRRIEGEIFSVPFPEVCAEINFLVSVIRNDILVDKRVN